MHTVAQEDQEAKFVQMGRAILHTQKAEVSFASSVQEMHRDLWSLVESAPYLVEGGGGVLFVAPRFNNYEVFDDFSLLVRSGLRGLVNSKLYLQSYHPIHRSTSQSKSLELSRADLLRAAGVVHMAPEAAGWEGMVSPRRPRPSPV